jgi:hypothetical protein
LDWRWKVELVWNMYDMKCVQGGTTLTAAMGFVSWAGDVSEGISVEIYETPATNALI